MYHDFINHQLSNSFIGWTIPLNEQQQQPLKKPRSDSRSLNSNNKSQHFMQIQPQLIPASTNAASSSLFPPQLSEEKLRVQSTKLLSSKHNSTPSNVKVSSLRQDDSDAATVNNSSREGHAQHSIPYDSETSSGTSESLSGFSSCSIPSKQRRQQDSNSPKLYTEEQIEFNNQQEITFGQGSQCKRTITSIDQNSIKQKQYAEIPRGEREKDPFSYIFEWNTFCSENLLINSMAQTNNKLLSQISSQTTNQDPLQTLSPFKNQTRSSQIKPLNAETLQSISSPESENQQQAVFYVKENEENILEVETNKHSTNTLTLSVKRHKIINKKKDKLKKNNKSSSNQNINSQIKNQKRNKNILSLQQQSVQASSKIQKETSKYYYQDPKIENYIGEEFQAVIPDIIPGYRPKLYNLKYDHSRVPDESFKQVTSYLHQTYGKCVTDEDVANIITETGYDITKVSALLEKNKYFYDSYFYHKKKLHNQRKGQIKRIGTLKRKRKNVLTL